MITEHLGGFVIGGKADEVGVVGDRLVDFPVIV